MMRSEIDTCTEAIEAGTIRKIRTRILPFLFLLYIICFLDRINIGFATLTMNKELAITSQQFGLLSGILKGERSGLQTPPRRREALLRKRVRERKLQHPLAPLCYDETNFFYLG